MNRREFIKAGTALAMAPAVLTRAQSPQVIDPAPPRLPAAGADGWVSLLNGRDLSGWYTMLQRSGKGVAEEQRMILMEEEMLHIMGNEEGKFYVFEAGRQFKVLAVGSAVAPSITFAVSSGRCQ